MCISILLLVRITSIQVTTNTTDNSAIFSCTLAGYLPPNDYIIWFKDNLALRNSMGSFSNRISFLYKTNYTTIAQTGGPTLVNGVNAVMIINNLIRDDVGTYYCRVLGEAAHGSIQYYELIEPSNVHVHTCT